jgi:hypothetical protein
VTACEHAPFASRRGAPVNFVQSYTCTSSRAGYLLAKRRARHTRLAKFLLKKLIMELDHDAVASTRPVQSAAMDAIGIEAVPLPGCAEHRARGLLVSGHVLIAEARGAEEGV